MNRPTRVVAGLAAVLIAVPVAAAAEDLPAQTADARGEQYFLNQEGTHYVRSAQEAAKPYAQLDASQQERAVAVADAAVAGLIDSGVIRDQPADQPTDAPAPENAPEEPLGAEDVDPSVEAPVANGLIKYPPVLTLDGNTYFLNKDGHTFVADVTRVNADVTPEEAATSEALVSANTGEVGRQGLEAARAGGEADVDKQYAAPARGLEAETGSNTLVRALFALVFASALGAAFFAFARRRLV